MATTQLGNRLTEQHRQRQLALRALVLRQVVAIWPLFDFSRIEESWPVVEAALMAAIRQGRQTSSLLAETYYRELRLVENAPEIVLESPSLDESALVAAATSLRITGLLEARRLVAQKRPDAKAQTLVTVSGSTTRHVLRGGRETLNTLVKKDRYATGYKRVTSLKPCDFCLMLAGRGAVYGKESGDFQAHDHCGCSLEPVFRQRN